jgi:hypothetical protein
LDQNTRLVQQQIKPRWLPPAPGLPLLSGATSFPMETRELWTATIARYEKKLHKLVVKHLPTVISLQNQHIDTVMEKGISSINTSIADLSQQKRAILIFAKLCRNNNSSTQRRTLGARRPRQKR